MDLIGILRACIHPNTLWIVALHFHDVDLFDKSNSAGHGDRGCGAACADAKRYGAAPVKQADLSCCFIADV
jgi:hypothetical protein